MLLPKRADRTSCLVLAYGAESTVLPPVRQGKADRLEPNASAAEVLKRFADQGDNELSAEVLAGQGTGAGPRVSLLRKSL
jgi:hypothetical protein